MSAKKVSILCSINYYCSDCKNITKENTTKCNRFFSSIKPQLTLKKNPESSQCCIIIFILIKKLVTYIYQFKSNSIETNRGTLKRHGCFGYVDSGVLN